LTIKSDDVLGRSRTYEAIVKGEEIRPPNIPASFDVLVRELKGLALDVEIESSSSAERNRDENAENETDANPKTQTRTIRSEEDKKE